MNNKDKGNANIAIGLCGVVLGVVKILQPDVSPPTGRWAFILKPLYEQFGYSGPSIAFLLFGLFLIVFGFVLRNKK